MNPLFFMFPQNVDYFVETALFEMDMQIEYGTDIFLGEWIFFIDDDSDDEDEVFI